MKFVQDQVELERPERLDELFSLLQHAAFQEVAVNA